MNDFHRGWKRQKHIFSSLTFLELNRRRHRRRCKKILDVDEDKKTKAAAACTGAYNLLRGMRKMSLLIQF